MRRVPAFERLTQLYLQTAPEYQTQLKHVWLLRDVPPAVGRRLNLPSLDEGIDLIACTRHGEYWAIQSKFRTERDQPLTRRELGTFTSLAFNTCSNIALAVVAHTSSKPVSKRHLMRNTTEIGLDRWQALDRRGMGPNRCEAERQSPEAEAETTEAASSGSRYPRQRNTSSVVGRHEVVSIMPCGTGKSLTAYWIAEALKAKLILVAVPSLALVRQSLTDWTREFLPTGSNQIGYASVAMRRSAIWKAIHLLARSTTSVCPRTQTSKRSQHSCALAPIEPKIVFTTYQSSANLAAAARKARVTL